MIIIEGNSLLGLSTGQCANQIFCRTPGSYDQHGFALDGGNVLLHSSFISDIQHHERRGEIIYFLRILLLFSLRGDPFGTKVDPVRGNDAYE